MDIRTIKGYPECSLFVLTAVVTSIGTHRNYSTFIRFSHVGYCWLSPKGLTCTIVGRLFFSSFISRRINKYVMHLINNNFVTFIGLLPCIFFLGTCSEPFHPQTESSEISNLLVAEGLITDEEAPFRVKLSRPFEVNNLLQIFGQPVSGANVQIFDDHSNFYQLEYTDKGWYETEDKHLKATVGYSYTLHITTDDGMDYESTPSLMLDVPGIDSVYFREDSIVTFENPRAPTEDRLGIFVNATDPEGETKYWKWDFEETWEVRLLTDSIAIKLSEGETSPPFIVKVNIELAEGVEKTCFITTPSKSILVESTKDNPEDKIRNFRLLSVPPKNDRFFIKYSLLVRQYAVTRDTYLYWKSLREANENNGSLYDRIPSQIFGNISCCNGKGHALGYFSAAAVKSKRIFIHPYDVHIESQSAYEGCGYGDYSLGGINYLVGTYIITPNLLEGHVEDPNNFPGLYTPKELWTTNKYCSDCRTYGTTERPDFW